ncbi:MAG: TonB-dependent receptor [Gammaproteobacteria bacterium]|nr:TonB-dependent receptor [Gammaproteobacteria bacterium]
MKNREIRDPQFCGTSKSTVFQSLALGFMLAHMPAMAQDQADTDGEADAENMMEEVIVSGTRRALQNSIEIKRSATGIVDALSIGDIGDIPSLSVGEAIEQITGATGHRFKGSVSGISIRGLGPFLSLQTFNGRVGTTAAASRDMNYQVFPSELTKSITIYKTQQADLIEGGIAGTIDIGTMRALEYGKRSINANLRAKYNEYADRADNADPWGYRGSISYIDQWELASGNELGFSIGYSRWDSGNPEETFSTSSNWKVCQADIDPQDDRCTDRGGEYTPSDQAADAADGITRDDLFFVPHSYYWRLNNAEVEVRDALMGSFEWRSERADMTIDWFWSDKYYEDDRHDFLIADSRREPRNVVHTPDYALLSFTGVSRMKSDGELYRRDETLEGAGFNFGYKLNDNWEVRTDISSNNHERQRVRRYVRTQSDYVQYDMDLTGGLPSIFFYTGVDESIGGRTLQTDFDPNNFLTFGGRDTNGDGIGNSRLSSDFEIRRRDTNRETKSDGLQLDAIWTPDDGGFLESVKFGVRAGTYQRITNNEDDNRKDVEDILDDYYPEGSVTLVEIFKQINDECVFDPFPNSKFFDNAPGTNIGGSFAAFDTLCATRIITNGQDSIPAPDRTLNESDIDVTENTMAGYAMANFMTDNFSVPIWGNFGVRFVSTEVDSKGLRAGYATEQDADSGLWRVVELGDLESIRHKNTEDVWLPSANVNFEMSESFMIRAAAYRAMSRFNPEFMGAGREFGSIDEDFDYETREQALQGELSSASGGNPYIKPFLSWNADVSFEWYLSGDTAFSAALYYKQFEAEVMSQIEQENLTIDGVDVLVDVRKPVLTGETSDLWGFELTASHVFSTLPQPFDGLGFKVSWNHTDTDFETQDPIYGDQIEADGTVTPGLYELIPASIYGQSDDTASLQLFWDIGSLNLSVFWKHRSEYFQPNDGGARVNRWFEDASYVDFSASYRFNSMWKMRFTAQNLTDEAQWGQRGLRHDSPTLWNSSGTRYELGATFNWD